MAGHFSHKADKTYSLHTSIVLISTVTLIILGAVFIGLFEWNNTKAMSDMSIGQKILNSFFQSVSARTAGFNSISIETCLELLSLFL